MGNGPHSLRNLCSNFGLFTEKCFLSGVCRMALSDAEVEKQVCSHVRMFYFCQRRRRIGALVVAWTEFTQSKYACKHR